MAEIRIKSSHPPSQGDFVEVEEENFDPETMELYEPPGGEAAALREQYQAKFGKKPFMGWTAEQLREKLAA